MQPGAAVILGLVIVVIVLIALAYVWYHHTGWAKFSNDNGDTVSWTSTTGAGISDLRFKDVVFTLNVNGVSHTQDVTAVLNGMAVAYKDTPNSGTLTLDRPLNPFSFVIIGINDRDTVPDNQTPMWQSATATLAGYFRTV